MIHELEILHRLLPTLAMRADVALGPGDDCAAVEIGGDRLLLLAVDQLVGDVHYFAGRTAAAAAGAKLLKRNLSDIAAMGGTPAWALLVLAVDGRDADWIVGFCRGAADAAEAVGVALCGGDLAATPAGSGVEVGSLTILGTVGRDRIVRRQGAKPGDALFVTGEFGNSLASGHHLDFTPRLAEGRFLAENGFASAMLDVSDGLLLDARRLADASQVHLTLDPAATPRRAGAEVPGALGDGEDYELLFAVPAARAAELERDWPAAFARLTRVGAVEAGAPGVFDPAGENLQTKYRGGYEH
jgi:thiamine-monophosphate kinase